LSSSYVKNKHNTKRISQKIKLSEDMLVEFNKVFELGDFTVKQIKNIKIGDEILFKNNVCTLKES
jgi:hypothetical protein